MKQAGATEQEQSVGSKPGRRDRLVGATVWLASLAVLSLSALLFTQPGYMDAYYYHHVAANVAAGRGFVEDYIWNYLPPPEAVSHPSNLYWMPLTSLVIVPFFGFMGDSFRAAQVPFVLLSSLLVLFTFWLGLRLSGSLRHALAAAALTLFSGFYFAYWSAQDSFALFALSANLVLLLGYGLLAGERYPPAARLGVAALAGGLAAIGHLTRADGVFLLGVVVVMIGLGARRGRPACAEDGPGCPHPNPLPSFCGRTGEGTGSLGVGGGVLFPRSSPFPWKEERVRVRAPRLALNAVIHALRRTTNTENITPADILFPRPSQWERVRVRALRLTLKAGQPRVRWTNAALTIAVCVAAYLLVMSPWFWRNWQLVGGFLPTAGLKTLFLTEYNDFYAYGKELTWQSFLAWGLGPIALSKLEALGTNLLVLFGMEYHLVPFAGIGLWALRRQRVFLPFFVYAAVLYLSMSLVFTFPSGRGSMLHSSAVLLPWLSISAVRGLDQAVVLAARRLRHWNVPLAQRNFTLVLVLFAVVFSAYLLVQEAGKRDERYRHYNEIASWLTAAAPDSLIMIADPPGYFYSSGKGSIVIPSDDLDTVLAVAKRYGATYLVLEQVHSKPLHPYYKGEAADPRLEKASDLGKTQVYRIVDR